MGGILVTGGLAWKPETCPPWAVSCERVEAALGTGLEPWRESFPVCLFVCSLCGLERGLGEDGGRCGLVKETRARGAGLVSLCP